MRFSRDTAELFVPDGEKTERALSRTTHLGIGAHQDDLEIMAIDGILRCYHNQDKWFTGVVMTDGSGSPREDFYKEYTDKEMRDVRNREQKAAAVIGEYAAQFLLDHPSSAVKDGENNGPHRDIALIIRQTEPGVIYTHNLADKHPSHIATTLRVVEVIRTLPPHKRPLKIYGCEVWRDLDWMLDDDKITFDCSNHESLQTALIGVFDSQICGGKRYDLATLGRRRANATYFTSHGVDAATGLTFAMDLTPLIEFDDLDISTYIHSFIERFSNSVQDSIGAMRSQHRPELVRF